jgi:type IV pilus assembly protein PilP
MRIGTGLAVGLLLCCSGGEGAPAPAAAEASRPPKVQAAASSSADSGAHAGEPFVYRTAGRRDPFRSYLVDAAARARAERAQRRLEETEAYELGQYHLSGVLTGTSQPKAMVEDPSGRGHVVRIGTRLGRAGGRVGAIDSRGVTVFEETLEPTGRTTRTSVTLPLPAGEADTALPR